MGFIIKGVKKVVKAVVGIVSKVVGGVFGFLVGGGNKTKEAQTVNNLNKSLEPEAYRKILLGNTAAPLDLRFWQIWGNKGTKFDEVIALATHQIHSVGSLYFEDILGINAANAATGKYVGVVTREYKLGLNTQIALVAGDASQYDANSKFEGCACMVLRWLPDEKKLPDGIPSRLTQICEGALVYDPRRDGTQPGGSGAHRANDRSTWAYATLDGNGQPIGRNNALQALWYLLGWVIPTKDAGGNVIGEMLVCGRGVDPQDINMATFIAGANACEVAGYYTDVVLSTGDDHTSNEDKITCDGLIGRLIDPGGLWSYYANVDDTANIAIELTDDDIAEDTALQWNEFRGMSEQFNQVGGKFINPSNITLFQPFPYPLVRDAVYEANLGVKRRKTIDFEQVLDNTLAQRLARLYLNQGQYQGELQAGFLPRAIKAQAWSVVRYTSERFGWVKLFRVWRHDLNTDGGVGMLLKEIHASIWGAGSVAAAIVPALGTNYDALQEIEPTGVNVALEPMTGASGTLADGFKISWTTPPVNVRRTEVRYRLVGTLNWSVLGAVERDIISVIVGPLLSGAIYEVAVRHISINEISSVWVNPTTAPANGAGQFALGVTGNVNYAAIAAAGGTAIWANVVGVGKPEDYATVDNNMIANASLKDGTTNWNLVNAPSRNIGGPGAFAYFEFQPGALRYAQANDAERIQIGGKGKLYFSTWVFNNAGGAGYWNYEFAWYKADGSPSSTPNSTIDLRTGIPTNVWYLISVPFDPPADAVEFTSGYAANVTTAPVNASAPRLAKSELGANISYEIAEPKQSGDFKFNSTGSTPETGEFPRSFTLKLMGPDGEITSGIDWNCKIIVGSINTLTEASGEIVLGSGGTITVEINNLQATYNVLEIYADYNNRRIILPIPLTKKPANAGNNVVVTKTSDFNAFTGNTYADITGWITAVMPPGETAFDISVILDAMPVSGATGNWTVDAKLQVDISGTPTDIGAVSSSGSNWNSGDVDGNPAPINIVFNHTPLVAGTPYQYRVMAKQSGTGRVHNVTGSPGVTISV